MFAHVEMTDTFGGEANYCWVKRATFKCDGMTDLAIIRRAKREMGVTGWRTRTDNWGNGMQIDFSGRERVIFINFDDYSGED